VKRVAYLKGYILVEPFGTGVIILLSVWRFLGLSL